MIFKIVFKDRLDASNRFLKKVIKYFCIKIYLKLWIKMFFCGISNKGKKMFFD